MKNKAARGAHCLHYGDGILFLLEISGQCAVYSNTGKQKGENSDQIKKINEVVKKPFDPRAGAPVGIDPFLNRVGGSGQRIGQLLQICVVNGFQSWTP